MVYYAGNVLMPDTVFEFETTPGASYVVYDANGKEASNSKKATALKLKDGTNEFTIKVTDGENENIMKFTVENGVRSGDAAIVGVIGQAPVIVDNTISLIAGGNSFSGTFQTRSPYATVKIFADEGLTVEMPYSSTPMTDVETNRIIDERSFSLPAAHAKNVYYIESTAENGAKMYYTLYLNKNVNAVEYLDVSDEAWYASYVSDATAGGILAGESNAEGQIFRPNDKTTRQEMATIAARLMGVNGAAFTKVELKYVDNAKIADWALDNVKACYFMGVMLGADEGGKLLFKPNDAITRQEVMVIVARMFDLEGDYDLSAFKDGNTVAPWAEKEVKATVSAALVAGDDQGNLNLYKHITRAEMAAIVSRILERQY